MLLLEGHSSPVTALAFSPDGQRLASGTKSGMVGIWNGTEIPEELPTDPELTTSINAIEFHPEGLAFVVGGGMGWLGRRERADGTFAIFNPTGKPTSVTALRFLTPELLVVGAGDRVKPDSGMLMLWDMTTQRYREPQFRAGQGVRAISVLPTKRLVAWAEWGRKIAVWDIGKPEPIRFNLPHNATSLSLHPDGEWLAVAVEWSGKLFHLPTRQERVQLIGHKGAVTSIAFSPDGHILATGSWDGTVRFWDRNTGAERACYVWPVGKVITLAFSPDSLRLAVGGDSGTIMLFDVD